MLPPGRDLAMAQLQAVDSVAFTVIADNITDSLSSVPMFVETEFARLARRRRGQWVLGGGCLCCAAHCLSCLVTVKSGDASRTLLFDTGPEEAVFAQNAARLGVDLAP